MRDFVAYPSRLRIALLILLAVGFVVLGLWMVGRLGPVPTSRRYAPMTVLVTGWAAVVFFGLCALAGVKRLFESGEQVRIGAAGIRWVRWSDQTIPWTEIRDVTVWTYKRQRAIVLHLRDPARFPGRGPLAVLARANRALTGGDIAISLTGTDRSFAQAMAAIADFRRF